MPACDPLVLALVRALRSIEQKPAEVRDLGEGAASDERP
jgi:hypothetical protein